MKRSVVPVLLLLGTLGVGFAESGEEEQGEKKIKQTIEAIQQAAEEEDDSPLLELLARIFAEIFWQYAFSVRFWL